LLTPFSMSKDRLLVRQTSDRHTETQRSFHAEALLDVEQTWVRAYVNYGGILSGLSEDGDGLIGLLLLVPVCSGAEAERRGC